MQVTNGEQELLPSHAWAAVTVHAEPVVFIAWPIKHRPQGDVAVSDEGLAHSAAHRAAHGTPPSRPPPASEQAHAWSSSASNAWAAAGVLAMQIVVQDPASAGEPPAPPAPLELELEAPLELEALLELEAPLELELLELVEPWEDVFEVDPPEPLGGADVVPLQA